MCPRAVEGILINPVSKYSRSADCPWAELGHVEVTLGAQPAGGAPWGAQRQRGDGCPTCCLQNELHLVSLLFPCSRNSSRTNRRRKTQTFAIDARPSGHPDA